MYPYGDNWASKVQLVHSWWLWLSAKCHQRQCQINSVLLQTATDSVIRCRLSLSRRLGVSRPTTITWPTWPPTTRLGRALTSGSLEASAAKWLGHVMNAAASWSRPPTRTVSGAAELAPDSTGQRRRRNCDQANCIDDWTPSFATASSSSPRKIVRRRRQEDRAAQTQLDSSMSRHSQWTQFSIYIPWVDRVWSRQQLDISIIQCYGRHL